MQSNVRAGRVSTTGLVALSILSFSGLALSAKQEGDPRPDEKPRLQEVTREQQQALQGTPQSISKALSDLRQAVRTELEKNAFLQGKGVDMASLIITTGDQGNAIAGAPTRGGTLPGGGLGDDRNPPPDPNRPEPGGVGQAPGEQDIVGVVMLVGTFRSRMDLQAQPAESSFRGDMNGGTFTVRRASGTSPMVHLVDANDRTVATVPIIGFQGRMEGEPDRLGEPGQPASTVPSDMRSSGKADWGRIYLSILHYFHPSMG